MSPDKSVAFMETSTPNHSELRVSGTGDQSSLVGGHG